MGPHTQIADGDALATYEAFAPFYDRFTADHGHEAWMADLAELADEHGVPGRRLLDVGCGTGSSFMPMLRRGYRVTACDRSPAMVERARAKLGTRGEVRVADMRALPWTGEFDLATCVDDCLNYLLSLADVVAALRSIRETLVPGGLLVFDVNALGAYRTAFADELTFDADGTKFLWRGEATPSTPAGQLVSATIDVLGQDGEPTWTVRHLQRHYTIDQLRLACAEAGLDCLEFRGEVSGRGLVRGASEEESSKIVCVAARPRAAKGGGY